MAKGKKQLSEQEFSKIKQMQGMGLKKVQIQKLTERSSATIARIFLADTFKDYKNLIMSEKARARTAHGIVPAQPDSQQSNDLNRLLTNFVTSLQAIDKKCDSMLTYLEGSKLTKKNRWGL